MTQELLDKLDPLGTFTAAELADIAALYAGAIDDAANAATLTPTSVEWTEEHTSQVAALRRLAASAAMLSAAAAREAHTLEHSPRAKG